MAEVDNTLGSDSRLLALLNDALHVLRTHLKVEVAFISQFKNGHRIFRCVDSAPEFVPISIGGSDPISQSYCQRVIDGRLPEFIADAQQNVEARTLSATQALPVGVHLSVPIRLTNGEIYGTLCGFSRTSNPLLSERDIVMVRLYADFVGRVLTSHTDKEQVAQLAYERIQQVLVDRAFFSVYQPIFDIERQVQIGSEMLTRFTEYPIRTPDKWFNEALSVGLHQELEVAVIRQALRDFHRFPKDTYLSFNMSPASILAKLVPAVFDGYPLSRIVLEVTEHTSIEDYALIAQELAPLRARGLRLAVDDAGAGYASFRHILKLKPDIIKLDASLVSKIDTEPDSRALAAALATFAKATQSLVVAEGVETPDELTALRSLNITMAQGYLLGRPKPLPAVNKPD